MTAAYTSLKCPVSNCFRVFPTLRAFKRHLEKCYTLPQTDSSCEIDIKISENNATSVEENSTIFQDNEANMETSIDEHPGPSSVTAYEFKKRLVDSSLSLFCGEFLCF